MIKRSKIAQIAKSAGFTEVATLLRSDTPEGDDLWRLILIAGGMWRPVDVDRHLATAVADGLALHEGSAVVSIGLQQLAGGIVFDHRPALVDLCLAGGGRVTPEAALDWMKANYIVEPVRRPRQPPSRIVGPFAVLVGHGDDPSLPSHLRPTHHLPGIGGERVKTPRQASEAFQMFVRGTGSGASVMHPLAGFIIDKNNRVVGHVSYNGRVWRLPPGLAPAPITPENWSVVAAEVHNATYALYRLPEGERESIEAALEVVGPDLDAPIATVFV